MPLISEKYKVDFSGLKTDLVQQALGRMLSQHYSACVLRRFVDALVSECQELYDACIDLQEKRTAYVATGENLNALGRIVGADRAPWSYDDSYWFFYNRVTQGTDRAPLWCIGAPMEAYIPVDEEEYRLNVILKAIKNHTLVGSLPEVQNYIKMVFDVKVSFIKTGPNQVSVIVSPDVPVGVIHIIVRTFTDTRVDHAFIMPFPATLDFAKIYFAPEGHFRFDRADRPTDNSPMAVGVNFS